MPCEVRHVGMPRDIAGLGLVGFGVGVSWPVAFLAVL